MSKEKKNTDGIVYSTCPNVLIDESKAELSETVPPQQQCLYVSIDKKQRGGKVVTLVEGFQGTEHSLEELAKALKTKCGVGGSVKEGQIIVQGEFRDKVMDLLHKMGFKTKKKGG